MRKILLIIFIFSVYCNATWGQEGLFQFSKTYFRSDPFAVSFSAFINHLVNDPSVLEKEIKKRTDSSLFSFSGLYKNHSPFFFKPGKVQILLQETPVSYNDSLAIDTIFIYQMIAYLDDKEKSEREVKKEFEKIHRVFNKRFYNSNYQDITENQTMGGLHNYFVAYSVLAPATVVWTKIADQFVLSITLRFKVNNNRAVLAASLHHP